MRFSFSMLLLYHAYVYLEFLILACTIYILAPSLFQVDGESSLYLCNGMQDESTFEDYCRYVVQPDGTLQEESLMSRKREPNEDYSVFLLPVVSTKYFLPSTPHISSLFLNVPNLRFTFL